MNRADSVEAEYAREIQEAAERFADHEGMSPARVLRWMLQFADEDLPLATKLLAELRYFNATNLRGMTRQLVQMIVDDVDGATPARTVFVPMSREPGGGADTVARALRSVRHPFRPRVMSMVDLQQLPEDVDTLVFLDDFSGTGNTLADWWANVEALVRPLAVRVVFGALVMTDSAADRARAFAVAAAVEELGPESNVLGHDTGVFDDSEKERVIDYCKQTGCSDKFVRGYEECGLLIAFRHACPNNSLPILWYGEKGWDALFLRRAI